MLHHTDERCSPAHLAEAARRFPNARFVAAHSGNTPPARKLAIAAARELPNYYLETASTFRTPGVTEELVAGAGAERVVFGSDTPLMDPRPQIGKIITADISDAAKRLILGENARRCWDCRAAGRSATERTLHMMEGGVAGMAYRLPQASCCGGGRGLGVVCSGGCGEGGVWWPRP